MSKFEEVRKHTNCFEKFYGLEQLGAYKDMLIGVRNVNLYQ